MGNGIRNPYRNGASRSVPKKLNVDFNSERVCPSCGKVIKISHNFCKYCGVDLSKIHPIGNTDEISKNLAIAASSDTDVSVRKEAVETLGGFEDTKNLGVITWVLLNDPDWKVRKEAADELGDIAHPYSMDALAKAMKDPHPEVREEAIEGLKKIKEKNKPEDQNKGKAKEREE